MSAIFENRIFFFKNHLFFFDIQPLLSNNYAEKNIEVFFQNIPDDKFSIYLVFHKRIDEILSCYDIRNFICQ